MIEAIWVLIIGAVLLFLGWSKKAGGYNKPATWVGVILLLVGAFWPAYGVWSDQFSVTGGIITSGYDTEVTVANGSYVAGTTVAGTVASNERDITFQFNKLASDTMRQNYSCSNYTVRIIAPEGSTNDELFKVTYSVPVTQNYDGVDVFYKSAGVYDVDWYAYVNSDAAVISTGGSGSVNIVATDSLKLELRIRYNNAATDGLADEFDSVGETFTVPVTINGETYNLNAIVITAA